MPKNSRHSANNETEAVLRAVRDLVESAPRSSALALALALKRYAAAYPRSWSGVVPTAIGGAVLQILSGEDA